MNQLATQNLSLSEKLRTIEGKKSKENVKVDFTVSEIEDFRQDFMALSSEIKEVEEEKKKAMANFTNKLKGLKFDTDRLLKICNDGYEYQDRECVLKANDFDKTIEIYDAITFELLGTRPQEPEERVFLIDARPFKSDQDDEEKDDKPF